MERDAGPKRVGYRPGGEQVSIDDEHGGWGVLEERSVHAVEDKRGQASECDRYRCSSKQAEGLQESTSRDAGA